MILWRHCGRSVAEVLILFWSGGRAVFKKNYGMKHEDEVLKVSIFCLPLISHTHSCRFAERRVSNQQYTLVPGLSKSFKMKRVLSIRSSSSRQPSRQINVSTPWSVLQYVSFNSKFSSYFLGFSSLIWGRSWGWCKTWSRKPCQFRIRQSERRERFSIIANSRPTTLSGIQVSSHFVCIP